MNLRREFLIVLALLLLPMQLHAANTEDKLHKIENEVSQHKQEQAELDRKAEEASENLKDLRRKLIASTAALQAKAMEEERLKERLAALAHDIKSKKNALAGERKKLDQLTEALVALAQQPPESLLLHTQLTSDTIHRAMLLRAIVPRLKDETAEIAGDLADFATEHTQMLAQKRLVQQAHENMEAQRKGLDQLIATRQGMLDRTQAQKEEIAKHLVALTSEAQDLRQLLEKVTPKNALSSVPHMLHGALKVPVVGSILHGYGSKDADGVTSHGLTFAAPSGSPVVAPAAGRVVFAGPFKGYGQILILQHGGGYHSFLAGFGRIDAEMGQDVEAGEPLGVLPVKDEGRPELYFEWRRNTEPVDPGLGR
jgi:septal ring factor EnvC (AmiA/AmiB activator)